MYFNCLPICIITRKVLYLHCWCWQSISLNVIIIFYSTFSSNIVCVKFVFLIFNNKTNCTKIDKTTITVIYTPPNIVSIKRLIDMGY